MSDTFHVVVQQREVSYDYDFFHYRVLDSLTCQSAADEFCAQLNATASDDEYFFVSTDLSEVM